MTDMTHSHFSAAAPRPQPEKRNEVSEITSAMGGAMFGIALAAQLPGGAALEVALLVVFGGVGWYCARQANKRRS